MDFLQQNILWVVIAVTSGAMLIVPMISGGGGNALSPAEATLLMNRADAVVVDVRETSEWDTGHIAGAHHVALGLLDKHLSEIAKFKQKPVIVVCASGNRSGKACGQLSKAGFEKVHNLAGGLAAWTAAGLPLTTKV